MDDPAEQGTNQQAEFLAALERATVADERFRETGDRAILMDGLNFWAGVFQHPGIEEAPLTERADMLREYGLLLLTFHEASGRADALQEANRVFEEASSLDPTELPWPAWVLNRRAVALRERYGRRGDMQDLDRAIAAYKEAVDLISNDPIEQGKLSVNLGNALRDRFWLIGDRQDLEVALDHYERAAAGTTPDPYDRAIMLNNLGLGYRDRYVVAGNLTDLERAVDLFDQAVDLPSRTVEQRATFLSNLGLALGSRRELRNRSHDHSEAAQDLARAINAFEEGLELVPRGSQVRGTLLHNLGIELEARYQETGEPSDLERAVAVLEEAVAETPATAPKYASVVDDLGVRLRIRYQATGRLDDLHRAIAAHEQAINRVAQSVPDRTSYLNNLAGAYWLRYDHAHDPDDLARAVTAYRDGSQAGLESNLKEGLKTAAGWGAWALERQSWQEAVEALGLGMEIAHRLFRTQLARQHKETWLAQAEGVAEDAAYALAMTGDPDGGAVALEQGRALLLSESLERTQADLAQLQQLGHTELAERYRAASDRVGELERGELATRQATASADERLRSLGAAKIELSDVIDAIRSVEGYEHFLDRPAFADVATAAATAPIVYLCASVHGGLALIVPPGRSERVVPVWLPGCSRAALRDQIGTYFQAYAQRSSAASSWQAALDRLTQWLWDAVMAPVLAALPATRAVLVPTGLLGLLPLHAAWTNDPHTSTGRRYALDEALLTYTPNARTLTAARRLADQIPIERVLVVEEPRPVDASPLPHVLDEARAALAAFPTTRHLRHERATHNAVWDALNDHQVVHFACHGYANPAEPLASALLMAENQQLTLRHLLGSRLAARLVVLSACETALVGRALPNEVIGLPGGLLQAGAAGVIGSLWSVRDDSTMLLMTAFYQRWRFGDLEPAEALRQAQQWLRDHPETDGKRADDAEVRHGHMHPYRWAAFAYVGA